MSVRDVKRFPVIVCESAVAGLTDIEKLFIPMLVEKGKLRVVPDSEVTG
jgi:hypothetical protein